MSGLCYQCGPGGARKLSNPRQIKQVKMYTDNEGRIVYLCSPCARDLGYK